MGGSERRTFDLIDGNGFFGSRVTTAGPWVFFGGPAVDGDGLVRGPDSLSWGYQGSSVAQVRSQTQYLFSRLSAIFGELGTSLENLLQIEQYVERKVQHDPFLEVSRSVEFIGRRRPGSLCLQAGRYLPRGAVLNVAGLAYIPSERVPDKEVFRTDLSYSGAKHERPGVGLSPDKFPQFFEAVSDEAPFSEVVVAGPYVFNTVYASDYTTGPHPDMRIADWSVWGNEMRSEAMWMSMALDKKLTAGGTSVDRVVHCTAHLGEIDDIYELDLIWRKLFGSSPPARTLVPVAGFGQPRIEGAKHHWEGSPKMEIQFRSVLPHVEREVISVEGRVLDTESDAVRVEDLLWIGGQSAATPSGPATAGSVEAEVEYVFDRLAKVCDAGGSRLSDLLRIRAYVTNDDAGAAFCEGLKKHVPTDPPATTVTVVPESLHVADCSLLVDAVGHVSG